jgi:hypothetical protein
LTRLCVGESFVVIGNQARRLAAAEVEQSGMSQMAVNQHERSPIFRVPGDDQRLDNPYFADRGDDAL